MTELKTPSTVEIEDFVGLKTNVDSHDAHDGSAQAQVNATIVTPGQLTVRKGMRQVVFEN